MQQQETAFGLCRMSVQLCSTILSSTSTTFIVLWATLAIICPEPSCHTHRYPRHNVRSVLIVIVPEATVVDDVSFQRFNSSLSLSQKVEKLVLFQLAVKQFAYVRKIWYTQLKYIAETQKQLEFSYVGRVL